MKIQGLIRQLEIRKLIPQLENRDWTQRERACEALGKLGDARDVELLIARLGDENSAVRQAACRALGKLGDARAVEPLIARLGDENAWVRQAACEALGKLGDARAVEPLIARLGDENAWVRQAACEALGKLGDARDVELLIARLGDENSAVRQAACRALGKLGDARAVEPLIARLVDYDRDVRRRACEALTRLGEGSLARAVTGALDGKAKSLDDLGRLAAEGDRRAVELLLTRLGDRYCDMRQAACKALERLGRGPLVRAALAAAEGDTESISELSRWAAGDRHARHVLGTVVADSLCRSKDPSDQRATKAVLKALGPWLGEMLCTGCLVRPAKDRPACRACGGAARLVFEIRQVVAVLDEKWDQEQTAAGGVVRGNWLKRRAVFDFDRVEIMAAADEEVERFLIALGNDTDEHRQSRYKHMVCAVARQCALSENTLRILRSTFGEVTRV